jgi:NAD(P)-dependent dehydrogenase (short-subunit alcohol dehydrogenase family)
MSVDPRVPWVLSCCNGTMPDPLETARARWSGRTAVVTGAAGGLGAGFAEVLADIGARVVRCDVNAGALEVVAGDTVVVDVRDFAAVEEVASRVFEEVGDVALLINNAGVESVGYPWEQAPEDWRRVMEVNLSGVYHGVRAFIPRMLAAGADGAVLNIASVGALTASGRNAAYQVSKHGVLALSEALADGLATVGAAVQVSVALPGPVRTQIYADARAVGDTDEHLAGLRSMLADEGMPPETAAAIMLEQVAAGAFAVSSHPEWVQRLASRRAARIEGLLS